MKKTILCVLLALCLCLCFALVACEKDPETPPSPEEPPVDTGELGEKKGEIYYTADPGGDVNPQEPNDPVPGSTLRY